jgi:hypothetical protein
VLVLRVLVRVTPLLCDGYVVLASMERKHVRTVLVVEVVHASAVATTIRCVINGCHARIPEHHETTL